MSSSSTNKAEKINVAVRIRGLNDREKHEGALNVFECINKKDLIIKDRNTTSTKKFVFDNVFSASTSQLEIYKSLVVPMVDEVLTGYNCTIFAYGQTGTGKTYTMIGEKSDDHNYTWENDPCSGIIPRTLSHLFSELASQTDTIEFSVRVSFVELYNEELIDLLAPKDENARLALFDDNSRSGSVIIRGIKEFLVASKEDVYSIIDQGLAKRQTASTLLNARSSRSHTVFTVTVYMKETSASGEELVKSGKLNLVDLAGSENIGKSGATLRRAGEAGSINKSLLTLGRVITALVDKQQHIPYRESKLTRILADSLGGRTKTCIIATVTPSSQAIEETLSTLDYAHRAKDIQNKPEINQKVSQKALIREYTDEIDRMRRDLAATREKNGIFIDKDNYNRLHMNLDRQKEAIRELEEEREIQTCKLTEMTNMFSLTKDELNLIQIAKEALDTEMELLSRQLTGLNGKVSRLLTHESQNLSQLHSFSLESRDQLHEILVNFDSTRDTAEQYCQDLFTCINDQKSLYQSSLNSMRETLETGQMQHSAELNNISDSIVSLSKSEVTQLDNIHDSQIRNYQSRDKLLKDLTVKCHQQKENSKKLQEKIDQSMDQISLRFNEMEKVVCDSLSSLHQFFITSLTEHTSMVTEFAATQSMLIRDAKKRVSEAQTADKEKFQNLCSLFQEFSESHQRNMNEVTQSMDKCSQSIQPLEEKSCSVSSRQNEIYSQQISSAKNTVSTATQEMVNKCMPDHRQLIDSSNTQDQAFLSNITNEIDQLCNSEAIGMSSFRKDLSALKDKQIENAENIPANMKKLGELISNQTSFLLQKSNKQEEDLEFYNNASKSLTKDLKLHLIDYVEVASESVIAHSIRIDNLKSDEILPYCTPSKK